MATPTEAVGSWERRAVLCGIAFVALFTIGVVLEAAGSVDLKGTAAQVAASYDDNEAVLLLAERILVLAVFFLFAFSAGLGSALRRAEGPGGWLPGVAVAGGAAAGVLLLVAVGFAGVEVHEGVCAHDSTPSECSGAEGSLDPGAFSLLQALNFESHACLFARYFWSMRSWVGSCSSALRAGSRGKERELCSYSVTPRPLALSRDCR